MVAVPGNRQISIVPMPAFHGVIHGLRPSDGTYNIRVRGVDDSGNIGNAGTGITITVGPDRT